MFKKGNPKGTIDLCKSIDVRELNRIGLFAGIRKIQHEWLEIDSRNIIFLINLESFDAGLRISYTYMNHSTSNFIYTIPISWTPCSYGGRRPWFLCPGVKNGVPCNKRVAKLYYKNGLFLCRHCHNLNYMSSQKSKCSTELFNRPIRFIKRKLSAEGFPYLNPKTGVSTYIKPKGMHWRTYNRLLTLYHTLEEFKEKRWDSFIRQRISHFK